ncbi:hypothetical protein ABIF65_000419 [Bradyrhizobium japonicum]|jgi:hypothetical protein|uniref:hypothetical protein n=1 Tax=Bradyrhizobium TaxID=374 RepID=UPI000420D157|nr:MULTISPECIES: hypothetical protein [Bradyrhizobium]MBR0878837.1 hypothetical protein [Bradyrhizobium liaoningense]MBR0945350.1 hypothetical protein [Bradyrhizobium liaoningense]MBR0998834.1 hypothetical protein [Bradyrhizobium liaoningense]MBR1029491.1 hypothetical protein [Bradyrhizobium liaoningense]MBR1065014.1 hypothetical protein [Bradyrhizobium liaoningense]
MADADLDVVIRQLARQLHTGLLTRAKERRDRFNGLAAKAKGKETGDRFKMMAKATMEQATAAAKRLQMSADNVADSYARSMRLVASTPIPAKVEKKAKEKPVKKAKAKKAKAKKAK